MASTNQTRKPRGAARRTWIPYVILLATLILAIVSYGKRISDGSPSFDGEQNLSAAYNLAKYQVYSSNDDDRGAPAPSMRREPLYSAALALWIRLSMDVEDIDLECLIADIDQCKSQRKLLRWPQVIILLIMTVMTFVYGKRLTGSPYVALMAVWFVAFNPWYLGFVDRFYTEILASLLLLLHCGMLWRLSQDHKPLGWIGAGLSLGLLVLTKAVFFYWLVLLVPGLLVLACKKTLSWRPVIVFFAAAALLPLLWLGRNAAVVGQADIAGRGSGILGIRAEYTTMSWPEYGAAYLYYTPVIRSWAKKTFGKELFAKFDRQNPQGYYRRVKNDEGLVHRRAAVEGKERSYRLALEVILENWPKQLALIPLFAYRGVWQIDDSRRFFVQATLPAWGFLIASILACAHRRSRIIVFVLPVWFSIAFHSVLTHFIPRYSIPLLPVMTICAFWFGWLLLQHAFPQLTERIGGETIDS